MNYDRILIPLDGSTLAECVLPHALALAKAGSPTFFLLRVLELPAGARGRPVDAFDWQLRKAEVEAYLQGVAGRLEQAGLRVNQALLEGSAPESIIHYAHSQDIQLVLLSSHGQSGLSGWNVSSVVQKIILRVGISVMIVRAYQPESGLSDGRYRRILLPLDGSQRAECVLPVAEALRRAHDCQILAAHVVRLPDMPSRTPLSDEDRQLSEQVVARNRLEAARYLEDLKSRLDGKLETRLLVENSPTASLHHLAVEENIDLVIASAHGYSGGTQWPYGSTVISFIAYGSTPLLIVQDVPRDRLEPGMAELAARETGRQV